MPSLSLSRWSIPALCVLAFSISAQSQAHYLITNNDRSTGNSASLYRVYQDGTIKQQTILSTGGTGVDGIGSVATKRLSILDSHNQQCAFASDAGSVDVAAISLPSFTLTGTFKAAKTDSAPDGIAVVNNGLFLYAGFTGSNTIGTYKIMPGCTLQFIKDVPAAGLNGGAILDTSVHGNILVVSFEDGSIESFNVLHGAPVSNGDLQLSTGNTQYGSFPGGVDITADGHYALFGGTVSPPLAEVSDISSGKLTPTVVYTNLGTGGGSEAIRLSPDESLLYLSNFSSNTVTGTFFNKTTGAVTYGCIGTFRGIGFEAAMTFATRTGTGTTLYVAEPDVSIGFAFVKESSGSCSITEDSASPVNDGNTLTLDSIEVFPPRPF